MPLYSSYEPPTKRWLVFASNQARPKITVSSAWKEDQFVVWDDLQVHLPQDAIFSDTSDVAKGTYVRRDDVVRPLSERLIKPVQIGGVLITVLLTLLRPLFQKEGSP